MKRKFLSIVLALSMLLSFMPVAADAASDKDGDGGGIGSDSVSSGSHTGNSAKINISNTEINGNTLSFTVELSTDNSIQGTILAVVYDSAGVLTDVQSYPAEESTDITFTNQTDIRSVKVFWQYDRSMPFLTSDRVEILSEDLEAIPTQEPTTTSNITWKLEDGVLTISGTGNMDDYEYEHEYNPDIRYAPWYSDREKIKSVIIEYGVTRIGNFAFMDCSSLTSITIPDSVTTIGKCAFAHCINMTSISIPDSVTTIGKSAFFFCRGVTSITIPDSVTTIDEDAFYHCPELENLYIPSLKKWCEINFVSESSNPMVYAKNLYVDNEPVTELVIPDSVTSIGNYAFYGCKLTSVTIPDGVTTIGTRAFYLCRNLTSITIPDSVTTINFGAFDTCIRLTSITIPDSVTTIGACAFYRCTGLTSITIPDSVTTIDDLAFSLCQRLETVYYTGSEDKWNEISIGYRNTKLTNANIIYNYTDR
ncbi:MAG: leucine-rich repeat domain-containing protein [Oscillospiraceae bacterium]|nr:leucine-rich repeat domain-containing protein [Oscillospiraceae bacterium]